MKRKGNIKVSEVVPILYPLTGIVIIIYDLFTTRENVVLECYGLILFSIVLKMEYITFKDIYNKNKTGSNSTSRT
ncbi:hypothetical protein [Bacillus sp. NPDC094106]|uniref:hypothetical protein n=1 Tax=Bacillus sp. NPDC094106 TaxID=3363949 RepID=UPI00381E8D52